MKILNQKNYTDRVYVAFFILMLALPACVSGSKHENLNAQSEAYSSLMTTVISRCDSNPIIVGHRGAPGYTPEHTIKSYKMAIDMGADYIEPDLVITKDGVLIARHENEISETTDVAKKFPKRKSTKVIDGETKTGWFAEDFTLSEIKSLRVRERLPFRSHDEDGRYEIPTFEEILGFVKLEEKKRGRSIGVAPEIKHSSYFSKIRLPLEDKVIYMLNKYGLNNSTSKVMIQSFETGNLKYLRNKVKVELVKLLDDTATLPIDFKAIREYAEWVSPHKSFIVQMAADGQIASITKFIEQAHAAGLKVMPYTFRSDENFLSRAYGGDYKKEYRLFFNLGIDGLFSDFADHASAAKNEHQVKCSIKL